MSATAQERAFKLVSDAHNAAEGEGSSLLNRVRELADALAPALHGRFPRLDVRTAVEEMYKLEDDARRLRHSVRALAQELLTGLSEEDFKAYEAARPEARCARGEHAPAEWDKDHCTYCDKKLPAASAVHP